MPAADEPARTEPMNMPDAIADFLHMGGYAFYVWWSYAAVFAVLALNVLVPALRLRRVRRTLARKIRHRESPPR